MITKKLQTGEKSAPKRPVALAEIEGSVVYYTMNYYICTSKLRR